MKRFKKLNPAEVFMTAIDSNDLDARVTEALPWLPVAYPKMDWAWLMFNAKVHDRQNRLEFVTVLAAQIASERSDQDLENNLLNLKSEVETEGILDWTDGSARESAIRWAESVTARDRAGPDTVWWNGRVSGVSEQDRISAEGDGMHADCASIAHSIPPAQTYIAFLITVADGKTVANRLAADVRASSALAGNVH